MQPKPSQWIAVSFCNDFFHQFDAFTNDLLSRLFLQIASMLDLIDFRLDVMHYDGFCYRMPSQVIFSLFFWLIRSSYYATFCLLFGIIHDIVFPHIVAFLFSVLWFMFLMFLFSINTELSLFYLLEILYWFPIPLPVYIAS